jgi:autotransporter strand-loop-strand O-heptosyltransferase
MLSQGGVPAAPPYRAPSESPTQEGPRGIRFDFNDGCRIALPAADAPWRVRLSDLDTGNIVYETELASGRINSSKRYFVRFRIEVWQGGQSVLVHDYDAGSRRVLAQFYPHTLGDSIGWFAQAAAFHRHHGCRLTCAMGAPLIPLFAGAYPEIAFVTPEEVDPKRFYATYNLGVFFGDTEFVRQPCDPRLVGLHRTAAYILGIEPVETPPRIALPAPGEAGDSRPLAEPYACIATQATGQYKYWNNPSGWREIVAYLKECGYRVVCIDRDAVFGDGVVANAIPPGAEDQTGDRPLLERARWLRHAEFFIGLSSGLSWLAWAAGTPAVLISGFTHPITEFRTPYRVINYHVCNSCWNDPRNVFGQGDFLRCPRHKGTPRQFECSRAITAGQVKEALRRIPGFGRPLRIASGGAAAVGRLFAEVKLI